MKRGSAVLVLMAMSCAGDVPPPVPAGFRPTAIVVHSTSGLDRGAAIAAMERRGASVHALVDRDGSVHRLREEDRPARAARGLDDVALHLLVVGGVGSELLADPRLLDAAATLLSGWARKHAIPLTNADVVSRRGVFSHQQAKYRFGGLCRGEEKGRVEPGEEFMAALLARAGGTFAAEKDWVGRGGEGWVCVWEDAGVSRRGDLAKGRGLTPRPALPAPPLEVAEERRMRYVDRGTMTEVRGVVLHFTATPTMKQAIDTFERRRLGPSIVVDTDGRAWQVVDRLEDKVAAAAGTNDHCIQIEIVGENEEALLANGRQMKKVAAVVAALARARDFPLTNRDIDSLRGVFSHGQAKKRWGRSAWMWGTDFDPGERYMQRVLEVAGGVYVPEREWAGRASADWAVVDEDWLP